MLYVILWRASRASRRFKLDQDSTGRDHMPNELLFRVRQEVTLPPPAPLILGRVLVAPYDRIRVYMACDDASAGSVEVTLSHIVVDRDWNVEWSHILDSFVLEPQTSVNQVYDVPGVILDIRALGTAIEDPLTLDVVMWGFRSGVGRPPQAPIKAPQSIGTLVVYAMLEANIDGGPTPPDGGGEDGDPTPRDGGAKDGDSTPPDRGGKDGDSTPPDRGGKDGEPTPPSNGSNMVNAGAGVKIKLGGHEVGETDDNGKVRVDRLEGRYTVEAERGDLLGEAIAEIDARSEKTVQVILRPIDPGHAG
jgi:hypothetical protein